MFGGDVPRRSGFEFIASKPMLLPDGEEGKRDYCFRRRPARAKESRPAVRRLKVVGKLEGRDPRDDPK